MMVNWQVPALAVAESADGTVRRKRSSCSSSVPPPCDGLCAHRRQRTSVSSASWRSSCSGLHRPGVRAELGVHLAAAHRALRDPMSGEPLHTPTSNSSRARAHRPSLRRTASAERTPLAAPERSPPRHLMLRISPTTLPSTRTSLLRIGSIVSFSGCRRMWSASRKKRLTVASSPTSATTISPSLRRVLRAHDDEVALEDAGFLHRVAADAQQVLAVARRRRSPGPRRSPRCSPRRASAGRRRPAEQRQAVGLDDPSTVSGARARSSSSIARGFDGSRRSRPSFSRFARCACTVDDDARPTALPMSRTVGG